MSKIEIIPLIDQPDIFAVTTPFWTTEEGRSDLCFEVEITFDKRGDVKHVGLYDIRVP